MGCCEKVKHVAKGAIGISKVLAGVDRPARHIIDQRLKACTGIPIGGSSCCPFYRRGKCQKCGCWIALKAKVGAESCPMGRWQAMTS